MAEVTLENVVKIYPGDVRAVDNIDLTIRDREFVVLVGPSGCGKSTTLRMIAGLEDITEGRIRIGDRIVNGVAPKDRDIAMVFQNYALYPHMTVFKNMAFGLMLRREHALWDNILWRFLNPPAHRRARAERDAINGRVRDTASILGIEELLERRPKALSGGQRQRVALGRAIVRQPKAYLFDEPLSNLDAKLRVEMRAELKRIHRKVNTTTVYVTHDQEEAMTLGDRVVVMKDGIIHQCDTPFAVYDRPVDRFVSSFVGTPPMNFIDGRIVPNGDGLAFFDGKNTIVVNEIHRPRLESWVNRSVVMGIRPEALSVSTGESGSISLIRVMVNVVEPLGDRMDVYANTENNVSLVCRVGSDSIVKEGEPIDMQVDSDRVHFFELDEAGRNLCLA